jgi:transcriptional antiterminator
LIAGGNDKYIRASKLSIKATRRYIQVRIQKLKQIMSTNINYIFKKPGPATLTKEKILHISFCSLDISTKDDEMDLPFLYLITTFPKTFHEAISKC